MGQIVEKGTMVTIVISLGPQQGTVPNVLGMSEKEAKEALKKAGFVESRIIVDEERIYSDTYPEGAVARIYTFDGDLKSGDKINYTTDIYLSVSRGATFFVDPALYLGQTDIDGAVTTLQLMGLVVRTVPEPSSTFPNGQICWLTLEADSRDVTADHVFNKGDTIYLHYSTQGESAEPTEAPTEAPTQPTEAPTQPATEEQTTEVPGPESTVRIDPNYYQGRSDIDAAVAELEALGLVVKKKGGDITADTPLAKGSTVWLHYSLKEETAP